MHISNYLKPIPMKTINPHKRLTAVLIISFVACALHAAIMISIQDDNTKNVVYRYDESGNRVARVVQTSKAIQKSPAARKPNNVADITPVSAGCYMVDLDKTLVPGECHIYVYDTAGKMIYTKRPGKHKNIIDIIQSGNGCYIIKVMSKNGMSTFKITKD